MEIDYKKLIFESPENVFDAIDMMIELNSELTQAIHLMNMAVTLNDSEYKEIHQANMEKFLTKYAK